MSFFLKVPVESELRSVFSKQKGWILIKKFHLYSLVICKLKKFLLAGTLQWSSAD